MAEITLVKGETSALDRTWMSMPDGSTRQVAVHAVHDLPHLVVESLFGIEDGLWGVLAEGGFASAGGTSALAGGTFALARGVSILAGGTSTFAIGISSLSADSTSVPPASSI